jgi:hypothetical protein
MRNAKLSPNFPTGLIEAIWHVLGICKCKKDMHVGMGEGTTHTDSGPEPPVWLVGWYGFGRTNWQGAN